MIAEGQRVLYAGDADPFNEVGAPGKVIAMSGEAAHVQWTGGPKQGAIELMEPHEIVADRQQASAALGGDHAYFEASLAVASAGDATRMQVRASYDEHGEDGAISTLDESGVMAMLAAYAEGAHLDLLGQIHADATMRSALAGLAQDERDVVVAKVAATLLADVLREG